MFRSIRARAAAVLLAAVPLTLALTAEPVATAKPFDPHFPKVLTCTLSKDLVIGGRAVPAGKYALSARKTERGWELVLHEGKGFSTKIGADAHVLKTEFVADAPMCEHLNIDVQPGGDKEHTVLHLDVHFDRLMARALIEIPE